MNTLDIMRAAPVIPVIVIDDIEDAVPLARALVEGGLPVLEVTLRTSHGLAAIRSIAENVQGAVVGVGTLTAPAEPALAREAGAVFGVSPGLTRELADASRSAGLPLLPGVMTPSEVMAAKAAGYTQLKLFPAMPAGGIGMLNALAGPFPEISFCPTGGITATSAASFLACRNVICVGGSWLTPRELVMKKDWDAIRELAATASAFERRFVH